MEKIMHNEGLWMIQDHIFSYLDHKTVEICREVSDFWNEALERVSIEKYLMEFGSREMQEKGLEKCEWNKVSSSPGWRKAVKNYVAKSSIGDIREAKELLLKLLDTNGKCQLRHKS